MDIFTLHTSFLVKSANLFLMALLVFVFLARSLFILDQVHCKTFSANIFSQIIARPFYFLSMSMDCFL